MSKATAQARCTLRCLSCSVWNFAAIKSAHKCWGTNKVAVVKKRKSSKKKKKEKPLALLLAQLDVGEHILCCGCMGLFDVNEDTFQ